MASRNVRGLENVLANLHKKIRDVENNAEHGVARAGAFILGKSQQKVPVDFGVLKASGFVKMVSTSKHHPTAQVGYTAEYALYVHENLEARHGPDRPPFRRRGKTIGPGGPGQEAKFLENAIKENEMIIVQIVKYG